MFIFFRLASVDDLPYFTILGGFEVQVFVAVFLTLAGTRGVGEGGCRYDQTSLSFTCHGITSYVCITGSFKLTIFCLQCLNKETKRKLRAKFYTVL